MPKTGKGLKWQHQDQITWNKSNSNIFMEFILLAKILMITVMLKRNLKKNQRSVEWCG